MTTEETYSNEPSSWMIATGLAVLSLAVRMLFSFDFTFDGIARDTSAYLNVAQNIASGSGWVSHHVRFLFELPDKLPHPDSYWSPLLPLMLAGVFKIIGAGGEFGYSTARFVPLLIGFLIPSLVFLLARTISQSWKAGLVAGLMAAFHPTLVMWSLRVQPEILSVFFVTLALVLLVHPRTNDTPAWVGLALGAAYLTKYQNIILLPVVLVWYLLNSRTTDVLKRSVVVLLVFVATISSWALRNYATFGDPFHSPVVSSLISYFPEFGGEGRFAASLDAPPDAVPYLVAHWQEALGHAKHGVRVLWDLFFADHRGSLWLLPFLVLGLAHVSRFGRRWFPFLFMTVLVAGFFAATVPIIRYIFVLIPIWLCLAGAGAAQVLEWGGRASNRFVSRAVTGVVALVVVLAVVGEVRAIRETINDRTAQWQPTANFGVLEAKSVAPFIQANSDSTAVIMSAETYHYATILGRAAVQMPYDERTLQHVRDKYDIRYLVTSVRDLRKHLPSWEDNPPAWARVVHRITAEDIPRPEANPDYPFVSEMRVYRISADN